MNIEQTIILDIFYFGFGYVLGLVSGLFIKSKTNLYTKAKMSDFVALMVVMMWVLSMVVDILSTQYETSPLVQGLMGAIVGFFYKQKLDTKQNDK